jgi:hypothetical protein
VTRGTGPVQPTAGRPASGPGARRPEGRAERPQPDRADRVVQGGRSKAYRPLPADARRTAFEAGLAAFRRGDFFEAHELLEPAWMGTAEPAERDLYQGLIKLAAAYVHAVRGNPAGVETNLRGARQRLASAAAADPHAGGLDVGAIVADVDERLERGPGPAVERPLDDAPDLPAAVRRSAGARGRPNGGSPPAQARATER